MGEIGQREMGHNETLHTVLDEIPLSTGQLVIRARLLTCCRREPERFVPSILANKGHFNLAPVCLEALGADYFDQELICCSRAGSRLGNGR